MITQQHLSSLIRQLQLTQTTALEYERDGELLSLKLAPTPSTVMGSGAQVEECYAQITKVVVSPDMGHLCLTHPLSSRPLLNEGDRVACGDIVAYLRMDEILTPITTEFGGTLIRHVADDNELIGYGCPVAEIATD